MEVRNEEKHPGRHVQHQSVIDLSYTLDWVRTISRDWMRLLERSLLSAWQGKAFDTLTMSDGRISWGTHPGLDWTTVRSDGSFEVVGECLFVPLRRDQ